MTKIDEIISFQTTVQSYTGNCLYSDSYIEVVSSNIKWQRQPNLNKYALIPILGHTVGFFRIALALIHMVGHLIAAVITRKAGHLCHVVKGAAELLRGVIEILPIIGNLFVWAFDARAPICVGEENSDYTHYSVFLVKIIHPECLDFIDLYREKHHAPRHSWQTDLSAS